MDTKLFEIRDAATFIPALAIRLSGEDGYLVRRAGFGDSMQVELIHLNSQKVAYDAYEWDNRTMNVAHLYIEQHWDELQNGQVIDVEYILGETTKPKLSEEWICP